MRCVSIVQSWLLTGSALCNKVELSHKHFSFRNTTTENPKRPLLYSSKNVVFCALITYEVIAQLYLFKRVKSNGNPVSFGTWKQGKVLKGVSRSTVINATCGWPAKRKQIGCIAGVACFLWQVCRTCLNDKSFTWANGRQSRHSAGWTAPQPNSVPQQHSQAEQTLLKCLINIIVFLGKQQFGGHDEGKHCENKGNYLEIPPPVYVAAVNCSCNDWSHEGRNEGNTFCFHSSNAAQMCYVLRYVSDNGVKERFF